MVRMYVIYKWGGGCVYQHIANRQTKLLWSTFNNNAP